MKKLIALLLACFTMFAMTTFAFAEETSDSEISAGSVLVFGSYEQNGDDTDGAEPIEWIVLNVQDGKALLLSKDVLSVTPYNQENKSTTWETCTLRSWLNEDFYNVAFSDEEKTAVLITAVSNGIAEQAPIEIEYGNDTEDHVFLLSIRELREYMKTDYLRCCKASDALAKYGRLNNWYTRSPGENTGSVRVVTARDGAIWTTWLNYRAAFPQQNSYNGVRPCITVDLSSDLFHNLGERLIDSENQFQIVEDRIAALSTAKDDSIGKKVNYGNYFQEGTNPEPIEWIILDIDGERALLLSDKALDFSTYFSMAKAVTWEECTLRRWLNNDFMKAAFTEEEISGILESKIENGVNEGRSDSVDSGNNTTDFVFLLSYQEANTYFPVDEMRVCVPTSYAVKKGLSKDAFGYSSWWLRSSGETADEAMMTNKDGSRSSDSVNNGYGIRPAMWVETNALGL